VIGDPEATTERLAVLSTASAVAVLIPLMADS
jgi:hypothetical protein